MLTFLHTFLESITFDELITVHLDDEVQLFLETKYPTQHIQKRPDSVLETTEICMPYN